MLSGANASSKRPIYEYNKEIKLLNIAAIYGANGSGKSNLVKGLMFLQNMILKKPIHGAVNIMSFVLNTKSRQSPVSLSVEFIENGKIFFYTFSYLIDKVTYERLDLVKPFGEDETIYESKEDEKGNIVLTFANRYVQTEKQKAYLKIFEEQLNAKRDAILPQIEITGKPDEVSALIDWFKRLIIITPQDKYKAFLYNSIFDNELGDFATETMSKYVSGIHNLGTHSVTLDEFYGTENADKKSKAIEAFNKTGVYTETRDGVIYSFFPLQEGVIHAVTTTTLHKDENGKDVPFFMTMESDGTNRLFDLIPAIYFTSKKNGIFIIDEIDRSMHPILTKELVRLYVNGIKEPRMGQLIFTTHEANLLDLELLRKDEIWFVEKNDNGATELYPLSEFKVRSDLDIQKGYLQGRFGAIPFLGNTDDLGWDKN